MVIKKGKDEVYLVIFLKSLLVKLKIFYILTISQKKLFWRPLRGWLLKNKKLPNGLEIFHFETFSSGRNIQRINRAIHTKGVVG
jgi:hypothetical protein